MKNPVSVSHVFQLREKAQQPDGATALKFVDGEVVDGDRPEALLTTNGKGVAALEVEKRYRLTIEEIVEEEEPSAPDGMEVTG